MAEQQVKELGFSSQGTKTHIIEVWVTDSNREGR